MARLDELPELTWAVEARQKPIGKWETIAAFSTRSLAEDYVDLPAANSRTWQYRIVPISSP